ncbi:MAG: UDP-N-acetylglucosamine 2-epimerase (non-hydrolyzing) [Planctomycetia bacterium]|nr:UDP-N-acetylglucosamine 2-epimerase (non-hydrolyzing) [Planctomycetia bacterium]
MRRRRLFFSIGTRPEAVKLAPLVRVCRARPTEFEVFVCLSGQHRELVTPLVDYFELRPNCDLQVMSPNQNLAELTSRCLRKVDDVLGQYGPDFVIVQGDTTTAAATAQAAFFREKPIVHVEAGLRTGSLASPFPEEFNRRLISLAASFHCAPTEQAAANLQAEGTASGRIRITGNTGIDALLWTAERERVRIQESSAAPSPLVLITAHRRESVGLGIANICAAVKMLAARFPKHRFAWPLHPNPKVEEPVRGALGNLPNVELGPALDYPEFVRTMDRATLILTDSGGVQEEAPSLGKPVLVLRNDTERPEGIAGGCAELVGIDPARIVDRATHYLEASPAVGKRLPSANPYGDGKASERIADWLAEFDPDRVNGS